MLELIPDLPDGVIGIRASGTVTSDDYTTVLVPAVEEELRRHPKLHLLYEMGGDFDGFTGGAAWQDAKVGLRHLGSFARVAVVTDSEVVRSLVKSLGFMMPGEVRVFAGDESDAARSWISGPSGA